MVSRMARGARLSICASQTLGMMLVHVAFSLHTLPLMFTIGTNPGVSTTAVHPHKQPHEVCDAGEQKEDRSDKEWAVDMDDSRISE